MDLKTDAGVGAVRRMIQRADVVVESFRPGVMRKLRLDYESVYGVKIRRWPAALSPPSGDQESQGSPRCERSHSGRLRSHEYPGGTGAGAHEGTDPRSGHGHRIPGHDLRAGRPAPGRRRRRTASGRQPLRRDADAAADRIRVLPRGRPQRREDRERGPCTAPNEAFPTKGRLDHGRGVRHRAPPCGGRTSRCGR